MMKLLLLLSLADSLWAQSPDECAFTADCRDAPCASIADVACVCNFGKCVTTGNPFYQGKECTEYTDCKCKDNPPNCFCRDGLCDTTAWECHQDQDCKKMPKCEGKECVCQDNLCSWECDTTPDCKDHYCNEALGYTCECKASQCTYKQKPQECSSLKDCVNGGFCDEDKPCDCTGNYCTQPWWNQNRDEDGTNCRSDQDCNETILKCGDKGCTCSNLKKISEYESRGVCTYNN